MKNPLSNLQLRHVAFLEIAIATCEEGTLEAEASFSHELKCGLVDKGRNLWRVELSLELPRNVKEPFAYTGLVRVLGLFEFHPEFPQEKVKSAIQISGGAMLYSVIREMVANITSRCSKGSLMLPTLSFAAIYANRQLELETAAKDAAQKRLPKKPKKLLS